MKRILVIYISLFMFVSPTLAQVQNSEPDEKKFTSALGKKDGKRAADIYYPSGSAPTTALGLGFFTGPLGPLLIAGGSLFANIDPPACISESLEDKPQNYRKAFLSEYSRRAKLSRSKSSLVRGTIGFLSLITILTIYGFDI